jgi:NADH-quinone oxidoreductase subunit M
MILLWLILIPFLAGTLAWLVGTRSRTASRWIALMSLGLELLVLIALWAGVRAADLGQVSWLIQLRGPWIPRFGIDFHLALDGLSLLLLTLSTFLGLVAVACSWTEIQKQVGFFHASLLWSLAGIAGVFLSLDLFLFFFFWEVMLVPMYFLIAIWGHENRVYSAIKFFIFTQASSLLMLASIVGLALLHNRDTGQWTFDYFDLLGSSPGGAAAMVLMLGFFLAFAVKLPMIPLHTWLPDAHTDAPTAGSIILAGVLLKTGAYGLIRFTVPLFPHAAERFAPVAMTLAVASILYGAVVAFAQSDFKRLVAYTSISHLGFVLLGIFAWTEISLQGAVVQMIAHGISTGGLFAIAGALQQRLHTRDMNEFGGLWHAVPRMGAIALFFAIASLGLPGLGNFVGEFLVLLGAFASRRPFVIVAALGLIAAVVYSLILIQRTFHGTPRRDSAGTDLNPREMSYYVAMILVLLWLGLHPQPVLETAATSLRGLRTSAPPPTLADSGDRR